MAISVGRVWDRTAEVIGGRAGILAGIALLTIALPSVVSKGWESYAAASTATTIVGALLSLIAFVLMLWGMLAMVAVASDPAVNRARGFGLATQRLLPAIGLVVVLLVVFTIAFLPGFYFLLQSGFDYTRAQAGLPQQTLNFGMVGAFSLHLLAFIIFALWVGARLFVLYPVIQDERRGLGSFARSFALTRGSTLKIIGVLILYGIVFLVVLAAASMIVGLFARLALGSEQAVTVAFIVAIVSALVTAAFSVLQAVFTTQFYIAARSATDPAVPA